MKHSTNSHTASRTSAAACRSLPESPISAFAEFGGEATFSYLLANVTGPVEGTSATWLRTSVGLGASLFSCGLQVG
jgi:hypothetical protein